MSEAYDVQVLWQHPQSGSMLQCTTPKGITGTESNDINTSIWLKQKPTTAQIIVFNIQHQIWSNIKDIGKLPVQCVQCKLLNYILTACHSFEISNKPLSKCKPKLTYAALLDPAPVQELAKTFDHYLSGTPCYHSGI